jgi:[protein-PII] uridylyltransferase
VEKRLAAALAGDDYDFSEHLEKQKKRRGWHLSQELDFPTRISIDNDEHPTYTLIDIQTPDRLGLLYTLLRAIGRAGAHIALSRIATEKGAAIDTFYITDTEGRKLKDGKSVARLQAALRVASQQLTTAAI